SAHVDTADAAGGRLDSETDRPSSLAEQALRRHTPKIQAVCGKAARTVLCGGRAMKRTSLPLRRREFITLIGGAAVWPLAARAQQPERMRRIGFLTSVSESDAQARLAAFRHGLRDLGWTEGRNIRIDYRFADGYSTRVAQLARELIELQPDVNKPRTLRLDR